MQITKCKNCGAQLDVTKAKGGVVECEYCHSKTTLAKSVDANVVNFLAMGEHDLDTGKFDDAYAAYAKAAELDKAEPEAYFGMALAANKVKYIKDYEYKRLQPICYDAAVKSFAADGNYLIALSLATAEQKTEYARKAAEIDYIRKEFYAIGRSGKAYDCFICVKVSGEDGRKTIDSDRANDIYYHLKDKGYRPFYSEREIQNKQGADYEARILYALISSPCMLVVASDESYLNTPFVNNEYSRFIDFINNGQKGENSITIGFFDTVIERLPGRMGRLQGVCLKNPDAYSKIVDFVNDNSPEAKTRKAKEEAARKAEEEELKRKLEEQAELQSKQLEEFMRRQAEAQNELQEKLAALQSGNKTQTVSDITSAQTFWMRVNPYFERGDFNGAKACCERFLDIDPNNGEAWLGLFMITVNATALEELIQKTVSACNDKEDINRLRDSDEYLNAKKYVTLNRDLFDELDERLNNEHDSFVWAEAEAKAREKERVEAAEQKRKYEEELASKTFISRGTLSTCYWFVKNLVIPDRVKSIALGAFSQCKELTSVTIPDSVTTIGDRAFVGCSSLPEIMIPKSVVEIGKGIFFGCHNLKRIIVDKDNPKYHSDGNCIIETETKTLICGCAESVIPTDGSVKIIGEDAFCGSAATTILIPDSVRRICRNAFSQCSILEQINIPYGISDIEDWSFSQCSNLTAVAIPNSVKRIGEHAFYASGLTSVVISDFVHSICKSAFENCRISGIVLPGMISEISEDAFRKCFWLKSVVMLGVYRIGANAFAECSGLEEIVIPNNVNEIEPSAFNDCTNLKKVTMPKRLKHSVHLWFANYRKIKFTFTK